MMKKIAKKNEILEVTYGKIKHLLWGCMIVLMVGCGTHQAQIQQDEVAYLQIMGKLNGEQLILDNDAAIILGVQTKSFKYNGKTATKIQINPGTHEVKVVRKGEIIIHKKIYVSAENTYEIVLP